MATNEARIVISADDKTKGAFDSARRNMGGLADQAKGIGSSISGLGFNFAALGGAIAGAFSVSAVKGAIDTLDQLDDLAEKSGIAAESLSALRYAGEVVGTPLESLATGVRKLSLNMAAAAGGGKEQIAAFQAIGVSFKNLDGSLRGSDAMLGSIADKFASFRDGPEKAALAVELFGKAGADMIPLLNKGAAGIEELKNEASSLGAVFGGDLATNAAKFNDNLKKIQLSSEGFIAHIFGDFIEGMSKATSAMIRATVEGGKLAGVMAGLQTLFTGDDMYKSNVAIVKGTELVIAAQDALDKARAKGDAATVARLTNVIKLRREELAVHQNFGKQLESDALKNLAIVGDKAAPVVTKAGAAAKSAADEFQKLWDKIQGKASGTDADFAKNIDLLVGALGKGKITLAEYTQAVQQYIAQQPFAVEAAKAATKAAEERQALHLKEADSIRDYMRAQDAATAQALASVSDRISGLQAEEKAITLAATRNISLAEAVERVTIARLQERQAGFVTGSGGFAAIEREIEARQSLAGVIAGSEARKATSEAAKDAAAEWQKASDQINQSLSDALMDGFNAGKGFGKSFVDSITSMFKTMVLRPTISAIVTGATGSLGLSGTANAGIAGGLGGLGNVASLFGAGGLGGSMMAGAGWLTGATTLGGSLAAGGSLLGTGTLAGGMAGAGMIAGALAPIALGISAIYSLAKSLDHSGTPHTGGGTQYSAAGGLLDARSSTFASGFTGIDYSDSTTQMTAGITQAIVGILDSTATAFGQKAGYTAAASFADDSSKDGAWGSLRIADAVGTALTDWQADGVSFRTFSDGSAGSAEYLAAISADVRRALDDIDVPDWARAMLGKLGDAPTLEQLAATVGQITAIQNAIVAQKAGLQQTYDLLAGVTTQREIERAALDESNRALYDQITALQDQKIATEAAAEASARAAEEATRAVDAATRAASEARTALSDALFEIIDSIAGMRERSAAALAGVDDARAAILGAYNTAQGRVNDAQAALNNLLEQSADATRRFGDSLSAFLATIAPATSSSASLTSLKAQLSSTAVLAKGGDTASQAALLDQARAVLKTAEAGSRSRVEYARSEAFVRGLITDVRNNLPEVEPEQTVDNQIDLATAALVDAQKEQARYAKLAFETDTSILASTDVVGDAIDALRTTYDAAIAEQAAADLALNVALGALGALGLNEETLAALANVSLGGAAPGDFATALGVSQEAIDALQTAMRWTDADMQMLSERLEVFVGPTVYESLGTALGVPPELISDLATGLGVSAVQLLELNNALGLSADTALWMSTALGVDPATRQAWATGLGVDPTSLTPLATALGWNREDALALEQAIGISGAANAIIQALPSAIGLSASAAGAIGALPSSMGFSGDALTTATALATGTGFSDDALATVSTLPTVTGFSADALTTVDRLGTATGFSGDALATTAALATATGFSAAALATAEALADGAGFSGDALMTAASLGTATGFSEAALETTASLGTITGFSDAATELVDRMRTAGGFSAAAIATIGAMATAVDLRAGLLGDLSTALGLSPAAMQALGFAPQPAAPRYLSIDAAVQEQIRANNIPMPGFAGGTSYVPHDMTARIHAGEEITPRPYVDAQASSRNETNALLTKLVASNTAMQAELAALRKSSQETAKTLTTVTRGGRAIQTEAFV